ncbi:sugar porter family MFS transporter [Amycolatopsis taiwanensis]|uniref:Metabolite transport protein CsbC n=1 Tax=Amycolatopsis taiwanensis TaxID=342230 RepID=A0A9W6R993_9PSEU|nr:sugar porter family MFS transporter [Amycolatopsis taiwanensis]GLY71581.1 putative metabolite transport protein CsbC [Amycolatopsis taiwanensis]
MSQLASRSASGRQVAGVRPGLVYFFGALGAVIWGYDNGVIAGALLFITKEFDLTPAAQGLVSSSLSVGSAVGAAISGVLANPLGRKRLIFLAGLVFGAGVAVCSLAVSVPMLMAGRGVIGLGIGIVSVSVPIYLAELAPARIRGRIGALTQLMIASGILLSYLVGYALSPLHAWRWMIAVALVPALVLVVGIWVLPESPRWLLTRGRLEEARAGLARQVDAAEVDQALAEMRATLARAKPSWRRMFRPGVRRVVLVAVGMSILAQLLGINTVTYYAPTILKKIGFTDEASLLNTIGFGVVSIIFTVIATRVIDRWGRRPLLTVGALVMGAAMTVMAVLSWTTGLVVGVSGVLAILSLVVFKATYSLTWGTSTRIVVSEILPLSVRGVALGFAEIFNFASTFTLTLVFPILLAAGSGTAFITFGAMGVVACVFVLALVPETKGRTLEQIEAAYVAAGGNQR